MYITITSQNKYIKFDRLFKCPTGHLNGVKIQTESEFSFISTEMKRKKRFLNNAHVRLMHVNEATLKHTARRLKCSM